MVTWVEIDYKALAHNLGVISRNAPNSSVMAIVKANAYGHGIIEVAKFLEKQGVGWFGVTSFHEAVTLRDAGVTGKILILTYIEPQNIAQAITQEFRITLYDPAQINEIEKVAKSKNKPAFVHLKIETGLHRLGMTIAQAKTVIERHSKSIILEGAFTHFASSDADTNYTKQQFDQFLSFTSTITSPILRHAANSAAIFNNQTSHLDMVRPGIALYGYFANGIHPELQPALSWKAKIISIKPVAKNNRIGYGGIHTTTRDSMVAVVAVGYADGYSRNLSNKTPMLLGGVRCPVLGRVAMSMTMIDVTDVPKEKLAVGSEVIIIGESGKEKITALDLAQILGTNTHEILTRIPVDIPRVFK